MLVALVDYQAVPFYFNGSYGKTHYLNGSPTNNYYGTFSVTNLSQGYHDVVLVGFVAPDNFTYDARPADEPDGDRSPEVQCHRR